MADSQVQMVDMDHTRVVAIRVVPLEEAVMVVVAKAARKNLLTSKRKQ
jgi:uncharacterized lipoprotein